MGVIKLTPPISPQFECELTLKDIQSIKGGHLVRPCERYREMYKDCSSIRSRIQQYYVFGDLTDCSQHTNNYDNCNKYRKTKNPDLLQPIIAWEENFIYKRLGAAQANPVWETRESPPSDFDGPLPEFIEKLHKKSLFKKFNNLLKTEPW